MSSYADVLHQSRAVVVETFSNSATYANVEGPRGVAKVSHTADRLFDIRVRPLDVAGKLSFRQTTLMPAADAVTALQRAIAAVKEPA